LAVALANRFRTFGLDVDRSRIDELTSGYDRTGEIAPGQLEESALIVTTSAADCPPSDFYIVTVPTRIDEAKRPDLRMVEAASKQ
jgi:UDP-N-acetyl-D-galactosamine dehydrogenase